MSDHMVKHAIKPGQTRHERRHWPAGPLRFDQAQRPTACLVAVVLAGGQASHERVEDDGAEVLRALAIDRAPAGVVAAR